MNDQEQEEHLIAIWSLGRNCLVNDMESKVESTGEEGMFMAYSAFTKVPVWDVARGPGLNAGLDMDLYLDECFKYVWLVA